MTLPFDEAIAHFRSKVSVPSRTWTDLREGAHARSFTVAGATTTALVEDFRSAVDRAIAEGRTLTDFRKDFDRIVKTHGWSYKGGRGWRSAVIYNTGLRTARAAGRWAQIERLSKDRPWVRYSAILDARTRPEHREWNGTILRWDDPWWRTHSPPNGWNCRCDLQSLSDADLKRYGWTPTVDPPDIEWETRTVKLADGSTETWDTPKGVDTGFGYSVGRSWLRGAVPPELANPLPPLDPAGSAKPADLPPLPPPRKIDAGAILPEGLRPEDYADAFLGVFGASVGRPAAFRDAAGHLIGVGAELFQRRDGSWKIDQQGRYRFLAVLAEALKDPDEIWLDWTTDDKGNPILARRYLAALDLPRLSRKEKGEGLFAMLEWTRVGWSGVTVFQARRPGYLEDQRRGVLIFRRRAE